MSAELYIVRHATAYEADAKKWPDDRDRPLTPEGEDDFAKAARGVARIADPPDAVLASPAARAWRTAEILMEEAGWPKPAPMRDLEPDVRAPRALDAIAEAVHGGTTAIVGHDPTVSDLVEMLCGASVRMKKGGIALLSATSIEPGGAELRWYAPPKILRAARS